jgi:hypothetical protein
MLLCVAAVEIQNEDEDYDGVVRVLALKTRIFETNVEGRGEKWYQDMSMLLKIAFGHHMVSDRARRWSGWGT